MKKIIFLLILGFAFTAQAQYGNRNNQRRRQNNIPQTEQKAPEPKFEVEKYLGIVIYDIKKAAKKSSIKLSSKEGKEFSKVLKTYNKSIKGITRINSFLFSSTKKMVENFQKNSIKSGDFSMQPMVVKKMSENLKPISDILKEEDVKLDTKMKGFLSEKQYKKWIKYNRRFFKFIKKEK